MYLVLYYSDVKEAWAPVAFGDEEQMRFNIGELKKNMSEYKFKLARVTNEDLSMLDMLSMNSEDFFNSIEDIEDSGSIEERNIDE